MKTPVTEVVAALIWQGERFLICRRPAHKARGLLWEFVGGKVEPGETKEQALVRECREELAVTLSVEEVFTDVTHEYPDLTVHLTLFNATIDEGVPQMLEHTDLRWITAEEIGEYEFCPADVEILEKIKKHDKRIDMANIHSKQWWIDQMAPILAGSRFEVKENPCERENCVIVVLKDEYKKHEKKKDHYLAVKPYKKGGYSAWMKMDVYMNAAQFYMLPEPTRIHSNMPHFTNLEDTDFILQVVENLVKRNVNIL